MATLDLDQNTSRYQIRSYMRGRIQVNEQIFTTSLIITPSSLLTDWAARTVNDLSPQAFSPVISLKPDILLIGTGEKLIFPPTEVYGDLINLGIGVEIMDTRAACRTFNALSAENRNVVAALLI